MVFRNGLAEPAAGGAGCESVNLRGVAGFGGANDPIPAVKPLVLRGGVS